MDFAIKFSTEPRKVDVAHRIGSWTLACRIGKYKFFNLLTQWDMYLNPIIPRLLHVSPQAFMHLVGVVEIVAGVLVLTRFTRYAAYIVMAWLWQSPPVWLLRGCSSSTLPCGTLKYRSEPLPWPS